MRFVLIVLVFVFQSAWAQTDDFSKVRVDFTKAVTSKAVCKSSIRTLRSNNDVLAQGYVGVFTIMMAKHTSNPFKKLGYFQDGKKLLEQSLRAAPNNVELRFLRLSLQYNLPSILNYNSDIKNDREFIIDKFSRIKENDLRKLIADFLLSGDVLTESQKRRIAEI